MCRAKDDFLSYASMNEYKVDEIDQHSIRVTPPDSQVVRCFFFDFLQDTAIEQPIQQALSFRTQLKQKISEIPDDADETIVLVIGNYSSISITDEPILGLILAGGIGESQPDESNIVVDSKFRHVGALVVIDEFRKHTQSLLNRETEALYSNVDMNKRQDVEHAIGKLMEYSAQIDHQIEQGAFYLSIYHHCTPIYPLNISSFATMTTDQFIYDESEHEFEKISGDSDLFASNLPAQLAPMDPLGEARFEKTFLSTTLIQSAVYLANQERESKSRPRDPTTAVIESNAFVLGAIMQSVAFVEAAINELFESATDDKSIETYLTTDPTDVVQSTRREKLKNIWTQASFPYKAIMTKYLLALKVFDSPKFSITERRDIGILIDFRNSLVHSKPEWIDMNRPGSFSKLDSALSEKLSESRSDFLAHVGFPLKYLHAECAEWSVRTALDFTDRFFSRLSITPKYEKVRGTLKLDPRSVITIKGKVESGIGSASGTFDSNLDHLKLISGKDLITGTLNVRVSEFYSVKRDFTGAPRLLKNDIRFERCFIQNPLLDKEVAAVIMRPITHESNDYKMVLEIMAPCNLRAELSLNDGDEVELKVNIDLHKWHFGS